MKLNLLKKYIFQFFVLSVISMSLNSCDTNGITDNITDYNLFSLSDDVKFGQQVDSAITNNPKEYPLLNSSEIQQYVQSIVNQILTSPQIQYKSTFAYTVKIIRNDSTVNAFATPGGYIYVYTGLLKFIDNEATLAGVLAHEIAHAERRHSTKQMSKQYGIETITGLILGKNPSQFESIVSNLFTNLGLLKYSRNDESEADEYSFIYLKTSIWYPGAILFFFNKMNSESTSSPDLFEVLLSTHPMTQDRINAVKSMISKANLPEPDETNLFSSRYKLMMKTLP